jgi:ribonuclease HII
MTGIICGIDEAGRGPLVGNVVAGAVILNPETPIVGLTDSKKLSPSQRDVLYHEITTHALAWGVGHASPQEIDEINILQASLLAMERALHDLINRFSVCPTQVLVDGNKIPKIDIPCQAIIKGDLTEPSISAASIVAKVTRDHEMMQMHEEFPHYGYDQHMGYPTKMHLEKIQEFGIVPGYRLSFGPIKKYLLIS